MEEYQRLRNAAYNKAKKLRQEIDRLCGIYMNKSVSDSKPYQYYTSEIEMLSKKKERELEGVDSFIDAKIKKKENELEIITNRLKAEIEALEDSKQTKKQSLIDKIDATIETYVQKCSDIEKNFNRPTTESFQKKEAELKDLETSVANYDLIIAEEERVKTKKMLEAKELMMYQIAKEKEDIARQEKEDRERFFLEQKRREEEKDRKREERFAKGDVPPADWLCKSYEPTKKVPVVRKPLNGRDISKLALEEIDDLDLKSLTNEEQLLVADRVQYLEYNSIESKQLKSLYSAEVKKKLKKVRYE